LDQRNLLVDHESETSKAHVILEIFANFKIGNHRYAVLLQLKSWSNPGQHEKLGRVNGARGQDDFSACADSVHLVVTLVLHAERGLGAGVYEHFGDVRVHGNVEVAPEPRGSKERFAGAATSASTDCSWKAVRI